MMVALVFIVFVVVGGGGHGDGGVECSSGCRVVDGTRNSSVKAKHRIHQNLNFLIYTQILRSRIYIRMTIKKVAMKESSGKITICDLHLLVRPTPCII
ncbi:Hypothetical predicted protein [Octopus vulgaris]|uniref:Secreted protein n=1 Tax=Octopus vulgaris TaxID=6645 RepID=A0AA36EYV6_OCTVU|nr:Hypothetical predicted protein [Octopus vulgaris]